MERACGQYLMNLKGKAGWLCNSLAQQRNANLMRITEDQALFFPSCPFYSPPLSFCLPFFPHETMMALRWPE